MYSRVSEFRVSPEKMNAFRDALLSIVPLIKKEAGFRALVVVRTQDSPALIRATSVWESLDHLKASEKSLYLYQALSRVMAFSNGFPIMEECEVLLGEFAAGAALRGGPPN